MVDHPNHEPSAPLWSLTWAQPQGLFLLLPLLLVLLMGSTASAADVDAQVDRNPIALNESVEFTLTARGDVDGQPDFSPLRRDFDIIGNRNSTQVSIQNGHMERLTTWTLSLLPRRKGMLTVPAIVVGADASAAFELEVLDSPPPGSADQDLFIEVTVDTDKPYVQQQVLYTVRLYHAVNLSGGNLSQPDFINGEALLERLGDDTSYRTKRNGRQYQVIERRYALFPQHSGTLRIDPLVFDGQIRQRRRTIWDPFDGNTRTQRVLSPALELEVRPIPEAFTGQQWLPAHSLELAQAWSTTPPQFHAGEPTTQTIAIIAEGLTAAQLPEVRHGQLDNSKQYPDQAELHDKHSPNGIVGVRQQKIALIPQKEGELSLPEIRIPWWNLAEDRMETATLKAQSFAVTPGKGSTSAPVPQPANPRQTAPNPNHGPMPGPAGGPMNHPNPMPYGYPPATAMPPYPGPGNQPGTGAYPPGTQYHQTNGNGANGPRILFSDKIPPHWWPWISLALLLLWLTTLMTLFWPGKHKAKVKKQAKRNANTGTGRIRKACDANDPEATKDALLSWAAGKVPIGRNTPTSLDALHALVDPNAYPDLARSLNDLNRALYARDKGHWQGAELKGQLGSLKTVFKQKPEPASEELEPLYRA